MDTNTPQVEKDYTLEVENAAQHVLDIMTTRVSAEDLKRLKQAFEFARIAHRMQKRKSGAPYIIHPIAVANICAEELKLDVNSVITAFLHDVVEDTEYTLDDIKERFGEDVAFLVDVVTKKKKDQYKLSKQVDNYKQLLDSIHYDIRALMVKIADRLHNMRTLSSMRPDKQMKIAGETDYFYAPLANRLGLFDVKTDLENLSFKYRCPMEFADIKRQLDEDIEHNRQRLKTFSDNVENILRSAGIWAKAEIYYRAPYSLWRKMQTQEKDFLHIENRYYMRITFTHCDEPLSEKNICLKIYSLLTDIYKEKPASFNNQIDLAKENSYKSLNVMLLSEEGIWEDVQICSERMVAISKIGCMAELGESNVAEWMERFKLVLQDIAQQSQQTSFIESVATALYYDDVMVFSPNGDAHVLPKGACVIDLAFELHKEIGLHAKYARINGKLASVKSKLNRGDCVEIGEDDEIMVKPNWFKLAKTYKAKKAIRQYLDEIQSHEWHRCPICQPLPGGETVGIKDADDHIIIHRRSCQEAIRMSSKMGDRIVNVDFQPNATDAYPISVDIHAVDRYHLLMDLTNTISEELHLSIDSLHTVTTDSIVHCQITYLVHSVKELVTSMAMLYEIDGVDEVHQYIPNDKI